MEFLSQTTAGAPRQSQRDAAWAALFATLAAGASAVVITGGTNAVRGLLAIGVAALLLAMIDRDPVKGVLATFAFLTMLGLTRRLLIPAVGWTSNDPLVLVGPAIAATLVVRQFVVERRALAPDQLSGLVCAVFALVVLEAFNPRNSSIVVGLAGIIFLGAPMLWFFVAREQLRADAVAKLLWLVLGAATCVAAYGLVQAWSGLPSWDAQWLNLVQYNTVSNNSGMVATFGSFASSAEFSVYVGAGVVVAVGMALSGRPIALAPLLVLLPALFQSSNRTAVVLTIAAIGTMAVLRSVPARAIPVALAMILVATVFVAPAFSALFQAGARSTSNERLSYQLSGFGQPIDGERSTVALHWSMFTDGIRRGISDPFGAGSGSSGRASALFGGEGSSRAASTEVDISNAFVALGLVGGLLYLALIFTAFRDAARNFVRRRDGPSLVIIGLLMATAGGWLSGGHYATAPLVWLILGVTAAWARPNRSFS
ncbi:MAG: hypothetical protein JHC98_05310 [Thermoleophilaceae bacterium]|nr:hypothetical protein [Thermoleophilaceae bacterium]